MAKKNNKGVTKVSKVKSPEQNPRKQMGINDMTKTLKLDKVKRSFPISGIQSAL